MFKNPAGSAERLKEEVGYVEKFKNHAAGMVALQGGYSLEAANEAGLLKEEFTTFTKKELEGLRICRDGRVHCESSKILTPYGFFVIIDHLTQSDYSQREHREQLPILFANKFSEYIGKMLNRPYCINHDCRLTSDETHIDFHSFTGERPEYYPNKTTIKAAKYITNHPQYFTVN